MLILNVLSEALLYLCFSLLLGSFIINLVPENYRPEIKVSKAVILGAVLGIALFSFVPVLRIILYISEGGLGLGSTLQSVLTNFESGKSWIKTGILSIILFIFLLPIKVERKPYLSITGLILTLALIGTIGLSSHASSLSKWPGFFTHTAHFLAVSTWIGVLMMVSWFSKNHDNWLKFLTWFTPLAAICFLITIITGISLMTFVMDVKDYANTWPLSYGQALLVKHLTIVPLLVFAFINSVLVRKKLASDSTFNPLSWAKLECVIVLLLFAVTGALGQQSPPHDIFITLKTEGVSSIFSFFHSSEVVFPLHVALGIGSVSLLLVAIFFLILMVFIFVKRAQKSLTILMSVLFIFTAYVALMLSIK
jgi:putative copper export protein